jgi:nucleotidyltransferase substrate binding protein (TIGR01987 family)
MTAPDVRWKRRFQNYDRAFTLLREGLGGRSLDDFSELEREGLIQRFEFTFEPGWKLLKDYLEFSGVVLNPVTPREVIKAAFAAGLVTNGQLWIDMMLDRNRLSHTYDFSVFTDVLQALVSRYLTALDEVHDAFLARSVGP